MKNPLIHMILDDVLMNDLNARSKMMPAPGLLARMKTAGQTAADSFLAEHADALNRRDHGGPVHAVQRLGDHRIGPVQTPLARLT